MQIAPISFKAVHRVISGKTHGIDDNGIKTDMEMASNARKNGVDVPKYVVKEFSYETKGEKASFYRNPISKKHLESVFKNIFILDKQGIYHNDLDLEHIYYATDGSIEIDCFRFAQKLQKNNPTLPEFVAPTNQINFETASLAKYTSTIFDENEKRNFVADYLKASAKFHQKRSGLIARTLETGNSENYSPKMLDYEQVKAQALQNIDDDKISLTLQRLDFLGKQRMAFTEWDEGNGACGHEFSKERRINSILMYFDALNSAIEYSNQAKKLSQNSQGVESKYYAYEAKSGEFFANTYLSWMRGMAKYNFQDEKMGSKFSDEEIKAIDAEFKKIINADFDDKKDAIDEYLEIYNLNSKKLSS